VNFRKIFARKSQLVYWSDIAAANANPIIVFFTCL